MPVMTLLRKRVVCGKWSLLWATAAANLASTILGIPLTWGALALLEMGFGLPASQALFQKNWNSPMARAITTILTAPWLLPQTAETAAWAIPLATLVLLVPFFFVSVWSERLVMQYVLPRSAIFALQPGDTNESAMRRAVRDANLLSYAILFLLALGWLLSRPVLIHRIW